MEVIQNLDFKHKAVLLAICSVESNKIDQAPYTALKNVKTKHDRFKKVKKGNKIITIVDHDRPGQPSYGICQVQAPTAKVSGYKGKDPKTELMQVERNLKYAKRELKRQLKRYDGNLRKAISAYNMGHASKYNKEYVDEVLSRAHYFKPLFTK